MAITVWPVNAVTGAPAYSGRMIRQASGLLVPQNPARPLGGVSGVAIGSGAVVTVSGTTYTVGIHRGLLDLESSAIAGPYLYAVDAAVALTGAAADATNPRWDLVVATLSDPAEADGSSTPSVAFSVVTGVAAASPADPSVPARSMAIARVAVPKVGGGSATVTMLCPEVGGSGTPVRVRSAAQRDALTPYDGLQVYRLDTGRTETYAAASSSWMTTGQTYTPAFTAATTNPTLGTGWVSSGWYNRSADGMVDVIMQGNIGGAGANAGSGAYRWGLPITAATLAGQTSPRVGMAQWYVPGTGYYSGHVILNAGGSTVSIFGATWGGTADFFSGAYPTPVGLSTGWNLQLRYPAA